MKYFKYSIALSVGIGMLFPIVSSAQSIADLQAQINVLLEQVKALQLQLTLVQNSTSGFCYTFNTNLGIGAQNDDVTNLYRAMIAQGLFDQDEAFQDGRQVLYFSERLASAIVAFQERYRSEILTPLGLKSGTGYVGLRTRAKLNSLYRCFPLAPAIPQPGNQPGNQVGTPEAPIPASPTTSPITSPTSPDVVVTVPPIAGLGDVNLDGLINSADTTRIQQYIDGIKPLAGQSIYNADVDGDGRVTKFDLRAVADYASCLISTFPRGNTTATRTCTSTQ